METYQPTLLDRALLAIDHFSADPEISGIILRVEGMDSLPIWLMESLANMGYEYASLNLEGEHNDLVHWKEIKGGEYAFPIVIIEEPNVEDCPRLGYRG